MPTARVTSDIESPPWHVRLAPKAVVGLLAKQIRTATAACPLLTMMVAASLGREALTARKTTGVLIAMMSVALALLSGLTSAPPGAWCGDALVLCAAICMVFYSVWPRPLIRRSGPLQFTTRTGPLRARVESNSVTPINTGSSVKAEIDGSCRAATCRGP